MGEIEGLIFWMKLRNERGEADQQKALPGKGTVLLENLMPGESGDVKTHTCLSASIDDGLNCGLSFEKSRNPDGEKNANRRVSMIVLYISMSYV